MSDLGQPTPPVRSAGPSDALQDPVVLIGFGTAVLVIIGSFGPWVSVMGLTKSGTDADGVVTLILAVVAGAALAVGTIIAPSRAIALWVSAAAAVLATITAVYDTIDVSTTSTEILDREITASVGWGLWLTLFAAIALTIVTLVLIVRRSTKNA